MKKRMNWRVIAFVIGGLLLVFCWWHWAAWRHKASIAAGFGARVVCSCRYVEGRGLGSCKTDLAGLSGMALVSLSDRPDARAVDASVPLLARRSAHVVAGFGCLMDSD